MAREDGVVHELALAGELRGDPEALPRRQGLGGNALGQGAAAGPRLAERAEEAVDVLGLGGLVEGHTHGRVVDLADVRLLLEGGGDDGVRAAVHAGRVDVQGVEVVLGEGVVAQAREALLGDLGHAVDLPGDGLQPLRAVVDPVGRGHVGEERLRRADVGGGLVPADVLLAGLHRHPQGRPAARVLRDADHAAGHLPHELLVAREEGGVRPAEPHRDAEALAGAHDDVAAVLPGRLDDAGGEEVAGGDHLRVGLLGGLDQVGVVEQRPGRVRVLDEYAGDVALGEVHRGGVAVLDVDVEVLGARLHDVDGVGVHVGPDQELGLALLRHVDGHGHRLGRGGRLVEEGGVREPCAGQVSDHRLEVEQHLKTALRDFGLVRGVGGVPRRVLEEVPQDDRGGDCVVVASADERLVDLVLVHHFLEHGEGVGFAHPLRAPQLRARADRGGDD
mmetsp:Transcript_17838/g.43649  ORF Transcript_17838/g.43649 Transcript_17838/m.43649 type:complete len:447 (+) Transcript_17838:1870-3210(+)